MKSTFTKAKVILDGEDAYLCIGVPYHEAKKFVGEMKQKKYAVEINEYREKRSLNANSYFWQLLDKMASMLDHTKEELYLGYVREIGPFKDFTLTEDEAKTFRVAWERLGTGWPTEQVDYDSDGERVVIRAYYGSSTYTKKRMSRLIDMAVQDAKAMGIETLPPEKLEGMIEEWN